MKYIIIIIAISAIFCDKVQTISYVEDYCWRDYYGIVPSDALRAGLDKGKHPIYIGQVLFQDKLISGKIFPDSDYIYFDWFWKEQFRNQNVKILCTHQPQKFEWIVTSYKTVYSLIKSKIAIPGGHEEYDTYIGRVSNVDENIVGKILCNPDECIGLYTTHRGKTETHKDFEVLTYNPAINSTDACDSTSSIYPIDIRLSATKN